MIHFLLISYYFYPIYKFLMEADTMTPVTCQTLVPQIFKLAFTQITANDQNSVYREMELKL